MTIKSIDRLSAEQITKSIRRTNSDEFEARARDGRRFVVRTVPGTLMVESVVGRSWSEVLPAAVAKWGLK